MAENVPNQVGEAFVAVKADASGVAAGMADAAKKVEDGGKRVEDAAEKVGEDAGKKMGEAIAEEAGKVTGRAAATPGGGGVPPGGFNPGRGYVPQGGGGGGGGATTAAQAAAGATSVLGTGGLLAGIANFTIAINLMEATVRKLESVVLGAFNNFTALGLEARNATQEVDSTKPEAEIKRIEGELKELQGTLNLGTQGYLGDQNVLDRWLVGYDLAIEKAKQLNAQHAALVDRLAKERTIREQIVRDQQVLSADSALGSIAFDSRRIGAALTELGSRTPR